ncbi:MAG TPA: YceH family protein [Acidimicrobiales bacterium]|nr:YceH family protein [Acidimicrobiales bacterium]
MERLTPREGRVVASLVEKQLTIPQHYPLTLNALVAACNQTSSRDPVTAYADAEVLDAIEALKSKRLLRAVLPSHGRSVVRYRHVLDETLGLDGPQLAVLAVLELRGPQTVAELRQRTERMAEIDSVDHELDLLASKDEPLVKRIGRRPGQKEVRWTSLLAEPPRRSAEELEVIGRETPGPPTSASSAVDPVRADVEGLREDVEVVRAELEALRSTIEALRAGLEDLRTSLGG